MVVIWTCMKVPYRSFEGCICITHCSSLSHCLSHGIVQVSLTSWPFYWRGRVWINEASSSLSSWITPTMYYLEWNGSTSAISVRTSMEQRETPIHSTILILLFVSIIIYMIVSILCDLTFCERTWVMIYEILIHLSFACIIMCIHAYYIHLSSLRTAIF